MINSQREDPMFYLVDHMISLALYDGAFKIMSGRWVIIIFNAEIPVEKSSTILKWRRDTLDHLVFTEAARDNVYDCKHQPIRARTWSNYLRRLGREAGLQHSSTQYRLKHDLLMLSAVS